MAPATSEEEREDEGSMLFIRRLLGRKKKERHPHAHESVLPGPRALPGIAGLFDHIEKKDYQPGGSPALQQDMLPPSASTFFSRGKTAIRDAQPCFTWTSSRRPMHGAGRPFFVTKRKTAFIPSRHQPAAPKDQKTGIRASGKLRSCRALLPCTVRASLEPFSFVPAKERRHA